MEATCEELEADDTGYKGITWEPAADSQPREDDGLDQVNSSMNRDKWMDLRVIRMLNLQNLVQA